jgi:GT2 family glycosyltransferase
MFEVIVVVDGSDDGTRQLVEGYAAPFALYAIWKDNGGRASACNVGLRIAIGDIVTLLDDDMEPTPEFLTEHLAAHAQSAGLGVVGAAPIRIGPDTSGAALFAAHKFNEHLSHLARKRELTELREFYSGNFSIARDRILAVGGFDESFRIYGNEDVELSVRLRAAGVSLVFSDTAVAWQHYEKTSLDLARDSLAKGRTAVLLATKHPQLAGNLRISRLASAGPTRLLLAWIASMGPVNTFARAVLLSTIPVLEALGFNRSMRFYSLWTGWLFWLGALGAMERLPGRSLGLPKTS